MCVWLCVCVWVYVCRSSCRSKQQGGWKQRGGDSARAAELVVAQARRHALSGILVVSSSQPSVRADHPSLPSCWWWWCCPVCPLSRAVFGHAGCRHVCACVLQSWTLAWSAGQLGQPTWSSGTQRSWQQCECAGRTVCAHDAAWRVALFLPPAALMQQAANKRRPGLLHPAPRCST